MTTLILILAIAYVLGERIVRKALEGTKDE